MLSFISLLHIYFCSLKIDQTSILILLFPAYTTYNKISLLWTPSKLSRIVHIDEVIRKEMIKRKKKFFYFHFIFIIFTIDFNKNICQLWLEAECHSDYISRFFFFSYWVKKGHCERFSFRFVYFQEKTSDRWNRSLTRYFRKKKHLWTKKNGAFWICYDCWWLFEVAPWPDEPELVKVLPWLFDWEFSPRDPLLESSE